MVTLYVELKIPDSTATTAFRCMERMGLRVKELKRYDYYNVHSDKNIRDELTNTDLLVNTNKHNGFFELPSSSTGELEYYHVFVRNKEQNGLLGSLLQLGLPVTAVEQGVVWRLGVKGSVTEGRYMARKAADQLLCNKHFQEYRIV